MGEKGVAVDHVAGYAFYFRPLFKTLSRIEMLDVLLPRRIPGS